MSYASTTVEENERSVIGWLVAAARADVSPAASDRLRDACPLAARAGLAEVVRVVAAETGTGWSPGETYVNKLTELGFDWADRFARV